MSEAKAPAGYVECPKKCGRWKPAAHGVCWHCCHSGDVKAIGRAVKSLGGPDWTPPAPHPERRAGQRWRWKETGEDYILSHSEVRQGDLVWWSGVLGGDADGYFKDSEFLDELTLLSDAPAEPAPEAIGHVCQACRSTARSGGTVGGHGEGCVNAPAPVEAKGPAKPNCQLCGKPGASCIGWCDPCWNGYMTWSRQQSGTAYLSVAGNPTRLPAPRLQRDEMETWALLGDA